MKKITAKLIKYFMSIITIVIFICFIFTSIFLSKFYVNMQYKELRNTAENIYNSLKSNSQISNVSFSTQVSGVILIKDNSITPLTQSKMGIMPFLKTIDINNLQEKGKFLTPMNEEFLYYNYPSDIGNIVVLQNNKFSSNYLNVVYIILSSVFLLALILSIPLISILGKNFTKPILQLQKASLDISEGNFDFDININTKDEIENLSHSIKTMASSLKKKYNLQRDFVANVSHDFKTPLSIIRNYSEAIYDNIIDEEEKKSYAKDIIEEVDRLNGLVLDLIELSKLQGDSYTLTKDYFNLNEFLTEFIHTFRAIVSNKNIKLIVSSPNIEVNADPKYIHRVLYNFIDNAIKFSFNSSNIEITVSLIKEGAKISVKNYGIGISENMLDGVWNRYYKHSESGGMGIGLAICAEILKKHNFSYGVTSIPNSETEFYFVIPNDHILMEKIQGF